MGRIRGRCAGQGQSMQLRLLQAGQGKHSHSRIRCRGRAKGQAKVPEKPQAGHHTLGVRAKPGDVHLEGPAPTGILTVAMTAR